MDDTNIWAATMTSTATTSTSTDRAASDVMDETVRTPRPTLHPSKPLTATFRSLSNYEIAADGCWNWTGAVANGGYGRVWSMRDRRLVQAHRLFYEHHVGPVPDGLQLDHVCRNPRCVNPEHLRPVTGAQNVQRRHDCKLTAESAAQIRALRETGLSYAELGRNFGISDVMARNICVGKNWRVA